MRTPPRFLVDLQACQSEGSRQRGIGRYSRSLALALIEEGSECDLAFALSAVFPDSAQSIAAELAGHAAGGARVLHYAALAPQRPWPRAPFEPARSIGEWLMQDGWLGARPDLVHVSSVFEGYGGKAVVPPLTGMPRGIVVSATVYDVIPLLMQDAYLQDPGMRDWYHSRIERVRRCDLLLAISEATRRDVCDRLGIDPSRVVDIQGAADARFTPATVAPERQVELALQHGLSRPFVMYTGGIDARKNIDGLVRAFAALPPHLRDAHQLAVVCSIDDDARLMLTRAARESGLPSGALVLTGFVSDEDLTDLYRCCRLFVFPSRYEGFGLPVLEAMSCGAPVIAADTSCLPEIVGRREALFDVGSEKAMTAAIARALGDDAWRRELSRQGLRRADGFSWRQTARRTLDAWDEALHRKRASTTSWLVSTRPALALVTPLKPGRTGIADYVTELLPHLARRFDLTLFPTGDVEVARYRAAGYAVRRWQELPGCWREFDAGVLYQLGDSAVHVPMLALLRACPGVVVMHDAYVSGLMACLEWGEGGRHGVFREMLEYAHGSAGLVACDREGPNAAIARFTMARWVARHATGIAVHSRHARDVLRSQGQLEDTPCAVIPQAHGVRVVDASARRAARAALALDDATVLVCSFGQVHPRKRSLELMDAWSRMEGSTPARLALVGDAPDAYGEAVRSRAASIPGADVEVTGWVDDGRFELYMAAADIAVQLRDASRGETSAAALTALAHGVPLVASRHGALGEIPQDGCVHIEPGTETDRLSSVLGALVRDVEARRLLGARGQDWVRAILDPDGVARDLAFHVASCNDKALVHRSEGLESRVAALEATGVPAAREACAAARQLLEAPARDDAWMDAVVADILQGTRA